MDARARQHDKMAGKWLGSAGPVEDKRVGASQGEQGSGVFDSGRVRVKAGTA